jgi:hypothetical protein
MSGLKVVEWRRDGHHRLSVKTEAGEEVGWVDLESSAFRLDREDLRSEFEAALRDHGVDRLSDGRQILFSADRRVSRPVVTADPIGLHQWDQKTVDLATSVDRPERPWTDLALNKPGQGIRTLAKSHRSAAPVRTTFARLFNVHTDERAYRLGADGEEAIGDQLARLPAGWRALHSVPVGCHGADIDHVVIGPGGVFAIDTKHHPSSSVWVAGDIFLVNGVRQPYVRNTRVEARRTERLLSGIAGFSVPTTGVVAVVGATRGFKVKEQPHCGSVHVVTRRGLTPWLTERPTWLDAWEIDCVYAYARRSTTWA